MFRHILTWRLPLAMTFFLCFTDNHGETILELYGERIEGTTMLTRKGRNITAFLGIPYAKPPVGQRRFRQSERWNLEDVARDQGGHLMATADGNQCPQLNDDGEVVGDEDCLFLNVYTPETWPEELFPTMVYIHGGDFVRGSGSSIEAGPEYLLDRDVVLVTINYRLGALGFLSTGDEAASGNWGLKDQAAALEWVQKYIVLFGGAVTPVTIFGQGAGGACASMHAVSDRSQGLFDRYISQSGHGTAVWVYKDKMDKYTQSAKDLGTHLNCPTYNSAALVKCLRQADVSSIVDSNDIFNDAMWRASTWVPTGERRSVEGAFLIDPPLHRMLGQHVKDCPVMSGYVHDEGLLVTAELYANQTMYDMIASNLTQFLRGTVALHFDVSRGITKVIEDFYFNGTSPTDKEAFIRNMTNFMSDALIRRTQDLEMTVLTHTTSSPTYLYSFNYRGTFSKTSAMTGNNDNVGVTHGDELIYLFPVKNVKYEPSETDEKMIDIMLDFWTSFAINGTPTSQHITDPNVWTPFEDETKLALNIGNNSDTMVQMQMSYDMRVAIWDQLLARELATFLSLSA